MVCDELDSLPMCLWRNHRLADSSMWAIQAMVAVVLINFGDSFLNSAYLLPGILCLGMLNGNLAENLRRRPA